MSSQYQSNFTALKENVVVAILSAYYKHIAGFSAMSVDLSAAYRMVFP